MYIIFNMLKYTDHIDFNSQVVLNSLSSNSNFSMHYVDAIKAQIMRAKPFFSPFPYQSIGDWATRLSKSKLTMNLIADSMDKIINNAPKWPNFSEFIQYFPKQSPTKQNLFSKDSEKEKSDNISFRNTFVRVLGEEKIKPYTVWWFKIAYNITEKEVESFGFPIDIWSTCAIRDWAECNFTNDFAKLSEYITKKHSTIKK